MTSQSGFEFPLIFYNATLAKKTQYMLYLLQKMLFAWEDTMTDYEKRGYLLENFRLFHLRTQGDTPVNYHYH